MLSAEIVKQDEYTFQHYGFSVTLLMNEMKVSARKISAKAIKLLQAEITEEEQEQLRSTINKILFGIIAELEKEARNIFKIPDNVVLENDIYEGNPKTEEDLVLIKGEIKQLQEEYLKKKVLLASLQRHQDFLQMKMKPIVENMDILMNKLHDFMQNQKNESLELKLLKICENFISM